MGLTNSQPCDIINIENEREDNAMDIMKRETAIDYTSWDLNTKCVKVKNRQKLEAKFKRKARRKNKENLRKILDNINSI